MSQPPTGAAQWATQHDDYDKRAMACLERFAKLDGCSTGSYSEQCLVLQEAQVWATLAQGAASRLTAEALPGVTGDLPVSVRIDRDSLIDVNRIFGGGL